MDLIDRLLLRLLVSVNNSSFAELMPVSVAHMLLIRRMNYLNEDYDFTKDIVLLSFGISYL